MVSMRIITAAWAWRSGICRFDREVGSGRWRYREQLAGAFQAVRARAAGEQAIVTDAVEAFGQGVQQEAASGLAESHRR